MVLAGAASSLAATYACHQLAPSHGGIAGAYTRFRGSPAFVVALCALIVAAIFAHAFLGFDPDWGITNLALSMESSVSVALLMMGTEGQSIVQRKQLEYMLHLIEAQHAQMLGGVAAHGDPGASPGVAPEQIMRPAVTLPHSR